MTFVLQLNNAIETVKFDNNVRVVILRSEAPGAFCAGMSIYTVAVFRISFRPIRELPIESNPNCSVNWLTVQK